MLAGQLIKEINGLVKILTNDDKISVEFHENESCTDGKTIVLPEIELGEKLTKKRVSAIRGLVDNECGHVKHTDMETMSIAEKRNNSRMLKFMLNVIEDCRVDSIVGKEMPGASINLDELHESSSKSMLKDIESIEKESILFQPDWYVNKCEKFWGPLAVWLLSNQSRGTISNNLSELIEKVPQPILKKASIISSNMKNLDNTYDSLNLASQALHQFGIKPDENNDYLDEIIQQLSELIISEIAKKIIEDKDQESEEEGNQGDPESPNYVKKYIAVTTKYDVIEHSTLKGKTPIYPRYKSQLVKSFQEMIQTECRGFREIKETGKRLDPKSLVKAFQGHEKIFIEKTSDKDIDTAIGILVDASGSMSWGRMEIAAESTFELANALQSFPIALEVAYFQTYWTREIHDKIYKEFPYAFSSRYQNYPGYRVVPNRLSIVKDFNQSINERTLYFSGMKNVADWANADGESLLEFAERLSKRPEKNKIMIVLSDGQPACDVGYPAEQDFLNQAIENIISRNIKIAGIGIQSSCVSQYYPNYSIVHDLSDLPAALNDICHDMLRDSIRSV